MHTPTTICNYVWNQTSVYSLDNLFDHLMCKTIKFSPDIKFYFWKFQTLQYFLNTNFLRLFLQVVPGGKVVHYVINVDIIRCTIKLSIVIWKLHPKIMMYMKVMKIFKILQYFVNRVYRHALNQCMKGLFLLWVVIIIKASTPTLEGSISCHHRQLQEIWEVDNSFNLIMSSLEKFLEMEENECDAISLLH